MTKTKKQKVFKDYIGVDFEEFLRLALIASIIILTIDIMLL
jgi:hypothetical protein